MKAAKLYRDVLASESTCINYLQQFRLFREQDFVCPGKSVHCGRIMKRFCRYEKNKERVMFRCSKKSCRVSRSVRSANSFFTFKDKNGRGKSGLTICQIVEIVYYFLYSNDSITQLQVKTGHSRQTLTDWLNLCREVCSKSLNSLPKMYGTNVQPIQGDEAYFQGSRKNNVGRLRKGDEKRENEPLLRKKVLEDDGLSSDSDCSTSKTKRNSPQVVGPWVFGLYMSPTRFRFWMVPDRTGDTLIEIINREVRKGSAIVTDGWAGYNRVSEHGFLHETVNHSTNFVNPNTGFHTQGIERVWQEARKWVKRARHAGPLFQSHLDEACWKALRSDHPFGLLDAFFREVCKFYNTSPTNN